MKEKKPPAVIKTLNGRFLLCAAAISASISSIDFARDATNELFASSPR